MLERRSRRALRWPRVSVNRITLAMGACGLVLILVTAGFIAWREHEIAFREARMAARSAAFSLADHASRVFEVADLALRTATLSLGDRGWEEAEASHALWGELKATADALPIVRDLALVDAAGRLRLASMAFPAPEASLAGQPAFLAARDGGGALFIGAPGPGDPITGRPAERPSFLVGRRLTDPQGRFRGMAAVAADIDYLLEYWRRLDLPHEAHVSLVEAVTGQALAQLPVASPGSPAAAASLGAAVADDPLAGRYKPAPGRLGFYHRVGDLPLYLLVSYGRDAVEADWAAWLSMFLPFPAVAIAALVAFMALARRQIRVEGQAGRDVARARAALAAANGRLEQRVAERTADLAESNAEAQRFAYIVSHDLRAPLVNIMGFTSELQRLRADLFPEPAGLADGRTAAREDFDEAIGFIQSSIDKMDRLIKAILLLARQGSRILAPEPVDTAALMRSIADSVAHRALSAGATLTIGPMPPLVIDRIAVEQVFSNLVDNAVKYLRPEVAGAIAVTAEVAEGRAVFHVADNGRGIATADHGRVFELFRRSGLQDRPGEGIGLAHVKSLVRQLGGSIALASVPGQGSTFTVVLPLQPDGVRP